MSKTPSQYYLPPIEEVISLGIVYTGYAVFAGVLTAGVSSLGFLAAAAPLVTSHPKIANGLSATPFVLGGAVTLATLCTAIPIIFQKEPSRGAR